MEIFNEKNDTAIRVFSLNGFFKEKIKANEVKSRQDARKVGPFCDSQKNLMLWVNWGTRKSGKKVRPYFRHYPSKSKNDISSTIKPRINEEFSISKNEKSESLVHRKAKEILLHCLNRMLENNQELNWTYADKRTSDFGLTGNFLSGARRVVKEYRIQPPFVDHYDLDIAILGEKIVNTPIILGAIELELTSEVDLLKTFLCKSLGFPLFCIDLKGSDLNEITEEWCIERLTETTQSSDDGRRRNYVFIHNMLYPVFLSFPSFLNYSEKHHYVIFVKETYLKRLFDLLKKLKFALKLSDKDVIVSQVNLNPKDKGSIAMFNNEGSIAGFNWKEYNQEKYIRIILKRPINKKGLIYQFHLVMTSLLTLHFDALVGYKYDSGVQNSDIENPIWIVSHWVKNENDSTSSFSPKYYNLCPKHVSEPIFEILRILSGNNQKN